MAITKFNVVNGLSVGDLVQIPVIDNTANVYANNLFVTGDSQLGNLATANYFSGTLVTSAQPNITSTGTLVSLNVSGNVSIGNNLVVDGNLTVSGTLVYENVETFAVEDPLIQLGGGPNGAPLTSNDGMDRGTLLHYYTTQTVDAFMGWDNSNAEFALGSNVSVANNVVTFNTYGNLRASSFLGAAANITGNIVAGGIKSDNYYFANGQPFDFQQAAGANYQIQYNLGNDFAASPNFTFDGTTANIQGNLEVTNFAINGNIYSDLLPQYNELQSIGSPSQRWKDIYLSGGTIYLGNTVLTANNTTNSLSTSNNLSVTGNLSVANVSNLGDVANVRIFGGTDGYALKTYGNGNLYWGIDTTAAAGSNTQVQFNNNGPLGASANLTYDYSTSVLTLVGNITSGNANLGNLASANYLQGTLTTGAQPNITSVGLLTTLDIDGNLNVGGNFTVTGNFIYANVSSLSINDPMIYLAANNVGDLDDIGIVGNWDDGVYQHGGIVRDHTDNTWKFFANVVAEPTNTVDWANATYAPVLMGDLTADTITANSANLGNLVYANYLQGTMITSVQPNITSVGTLTSLSVSGNITAGNLISNEAVKGANVYVNSLSSGQIAIAYTDGQLVGGPDLFWEFSNAALYTTALKVNTTITANGNITSLNANLGNLATANYFSGTLTTADQPNVTSLGTLANLSVSGNISSNNVSASGNVNATYFVGDGTYITGLAPSLQIYEFANVATGVNGYYEAAFLATWTPGPLATVTTTVGTTGTYMAGFYTPLGYPNQTVIPSGSIVVRIETSKATGSKSYSVYAEIYKRSVGGTETLLVTTDTSSPLTVNTTVQQTLIGIVAAPIPTLITDRIVVKIYGKTSLGTDSISIRFDDNTGSGLELPVLPASAVNFVPYELATRNVNLGTFDIISGNANLGNLAVANYFSGNGYFLSDLNVSNIGTVANANYAAYAGNVTLASQPNITSLGTLSSLTVSGTVTAGNISSTTGLLTLDTGTISVSGTDAGLFTVGISNVNVGMAGNVTLGATNGQVTVRNNLYVANVATITNLKINDFYSNRTPIVVTTNTVVDSFSVNKYRSAKYTMRVNSDDGYQAVEVLLIHDGSDSYVTIYGSLSTIGSDIITLSSDINSGQVRMLATTGSANTTVNLLGTYVAD